MTKARLARAAGVVAFFLAASKVLGFVRETSLAAVFGATSDTDAYVLARGVPYLLFGTISYALTTTFIPVYSAVREQSGKEAGFRFANTVFWAVFGVAFVLVVVGEILARQLVAVFAPGFSEDVAELTAYLSRIMFPMMVFQSLSGITTGILNAEGLFGIPVAAASALNVGIIASTVVFGPRYGIAAVAAGTLVGAIACFAVQLPALKRVGFQWRAPIDLRDPNLRRIAVLMVPAILGAGANQVNTLIDRILASGLPEGRIAALNYAYRLMQLAPGIIGASVVTVLYPTLSGLAARREWKQLNDGVVRSLSLVHFLLVPIAIGALVLREPLVRIAFERGAFDAAATRETAWALLFYSMGIAFFSMRDFANRVFFTLQDSRTPLMLGFATVAINVALNLILIGPLEQGGLALATVIAAGAGVVLSVWALGRKTRGTLNVKPLLVSVCKTIVASGFMGLAVSVIHPWWSTFLDGDGELHGLARVLLSAAVGAAIYLALTWLLKVPELRVSLELAQSLIRRIRSRTQNGARIVHELDEG